MGPAEPPQSSEEPEPLAKMSFGDHLEELRKRLMLSLIAVFVCVIGMMPFKTWVTDIYVAPYRDMFRTGFAEHVKKVDTDVAEAGGVGALGAQPGSEMLLENYEFLQKYGDSILDGSYDFDRYGAAIKRRGGYEVSYYLVATKPIEDFWTFMAASFLFSLLLSGPFVIYQIWAFISAGLYKTERSVVLRYLPSSSLLFLMGVAFGFFVVVPYGLYFLVDLMNPGQVQPLISVSTYFSLLFMMTAALGLVFQLPVIMLVLVKTGLVSHQMLVKNWRYVILILFVAAAVFTPPDPFTQAMMAGPMVVLYVFGLWLTRGVAGSVKAAEGSE